jgi:hypothetical protein
MSHIFLHVAFCGAMAKAPANAPIAMHVVMNYHNGLIVYDKVYDFEREGMDKVVEFDVPSGIFRLHIDVPKYQCSRTDFLNVLDGLNRSVNETLADPPPRPPEPVALVDGAAPQSFVYLKPTFVLFENTLTCNQPVTTPLAVRNIVEYDQGSYHIWLYSDPEILAKAPLVAALRLQTPTSTAHYIRVKIPFPSEWNGWPNVFQLNITEDMIDVLATDKVDVLLCPKIWETSIQI